MKFKKFDVPLTRVSIKEWGIEEHDCCYVRELTTAEYSELLQIMYDKDSDTTELQRQASAVVRFALDETGKRLFTNDDLLDIVNNSSKPARRIVETLFTVNSTAELKELEKN
jgi:hypothetical protein